MRTQKEPHKRVRTMIFLVIFLFFQSIIWNGFNSPKENPTDSTRGLGLHLTTASDPINISALIEQIPRAQSAKIAEWDNKSYQMLLITPNSTDFIIAAQEYADWKSQLGIPALVIANYTAYPGVDTQEQIRNAIISYYEKYPIQFVLLMADTSLIPIRLIYLPDSHVVPDSIEAIGDSYLKPTDFYYAELTGDWNLDGDNYWGELHVYNNKDNTKDEMDWIPEVAVGRFPASNINELRKLINKTIQYEKAVYEGIWMDRFLAASGILDLPSSRDTNGEDEAYIIQHVLDHYVQDNMDWLHLMEATAYYPPPTNPNVIPLTTSNIRQYLNYGASMFVWGGHGGGDSYASWRTTMFSSGDASLLTNYNMPAFVFADACNTNSYDQIDSLGERMMNRETAGAIGYIGAMRISWYFPNDTVLEMDNRGLTKYFFYQMFKNGYFQQGRTLMEAKKAYIQQDWIKSLPLDYSWWVTEQKTMTTYNLLGDPSVDIYSTRPSNFNLVVNDPSPIYEGVPRIFTILNATSGLPVPNARFTLYSNDGKYRTFITDTSGNITVQFPFGARQFNYSIAAHNMKYQQGTFQIYEDHQAPKIESHPIMSPSNPTVDSSIQMNISLSDDASGVCDAWIVLTPNNYQTVRIYQMNLETQSPNLYCANLLQLDYANYDYSVIVFDYAGNFNSTLFLDQLLQFTVPVPWQFYGLIGGNFVVALIGNIIVQKSYRKLRLLPEKAKL